MMKFTATMTFKNEDLAEFVKRNKEIFGSLSGYLRFLILMDYLGLFGKEIVINTVTNPSVSNSRPIPPSASTVGRTKTDFKPVIATNPQMLEVIKELKEVLRKRNQNIRREER